MAGLAPLVDTAIIRDPLLMMEGAMKLHSEGTSTTFTSAGASSATFVFISGESVAAITRKASLRSLFL